MALALPMIKMRAIFSDVASQHITESMGITRLKSNALKKAQAHNANMPQTKNGTRTSPRTAESPAEALELNNTKP
jgi:hypothetical protein